MRLHTFTTNIDLVYYLPATPAPSEISALYADGCSGGDDVQPEHAVAGHREPRLHPGGLLGPLPRHHLPLRHPVRGAQHQEEDSADHQIQQQLGQHLNIHPNIYTSK